jgi:MFS family permease
MHEFRGRDRGVALSAWGATAGAAVAVGPLVGGALTSGISWRWIFLINVPVVLVGAAAVVLVVPESRDPAPGKVDVAGVLLSVAGLVLVVYGIIQGGDTGSWLRWSVLGPLAGGLAVLAAFARHEARTRYPSLDVRLFRDPRLSASVAALALVFFGMAGAFFFLSFYLQNVRGYTPLHAGLMTLPFAAGQMLLAPRNASLVRSFGAKAVGASGLLLVAVALAGYSLLGTGTSPWLLGVLFFIQGTGIGIVMPSATNAVMSVLPREKAGAGSALTNTARQVSVALGTAVLGSILAQAYRGQLSPHLAGLPPSAAGQATASISATQAVAQHLGPAGQRLLAPANIAFVHALHITTLIAAAIALLGALVVFTWMPGRVGTGRHRVTDASARRRPETAEEPAAA